MAQFQEEFLAKAAAAAQAAGHIFPAYAACEAALESAWGHSQLALEGNNLFGQKQAHPPLPGTRTMELPTREYLHGQWVHVPAQWVRFADWESCFRARMDVLARLCHAYPCYAVALAASSGDSFVENVSAHWSTDPDRAHKVLAVYHMHHSVFQQTSLA